MEHGTLFRPTFPAKIEEEYHRRLQDKPGQAEQRGIEPVRRVMEKVNRSISRLIDLYSEGLMDERELEPRLRSAKERLAKLEAEAQTRAAEAAQQAELRLALTRFRTSPCGYKKVWSTRTGRRVAK